MKSKYLFPVSISLLYVAAGVVFAFKFDWRQAVYCWGCAVINIAALVRN